MRKQIGLLVLLFSLVAWTGAEAAREATIGGMDTNGLHRWTVESGDILPGVANTYRLGNATYPVLAISANSINTTTEDLVSADAGVAASLTIGTSFVTSTNAGDEDLVTLADGVAGQTKTFILEAGTEDSGVAITPANFAAGTDVLLDANDEVLVLMFMSTDWVIITNTGTIR